MARKAYNGYTEKSYYECKKFSGMITTGDTLNEGYFQTIYNGVISDTGLSLKPRRGYLTTAICKNTGTILTLSNNTVYYRDTKSNSIIFIDLSSINKEDNTYLINACICDASEYKTDPTNLIFNLDNPTKYNKVITTVDDESILTLKDYLSTYYENFNNTNEIGTDFYLETDKNYKCIPVYDKYGILNYLVKCNVVYTHNSTNIKASIYLLLNCVHDTETTGHITITPLDTQQQYSVDPNYRNLASFESIVPNPMQIVYTSLNPMPSGGITQFSMIYNKINEDFTLNINNYNDVHLIPSFVLKELTGVRSWAYSYDIYSTSNNNLNKYKVYNSPVYDLSTCEQIYYNIPDELNIETYKDKTIQQLYNIDTSVFDDVKDSNIFVFAYPKEFNFKNIENMIVRNTNNYLLNATATGSSPLNVYKDFSDIYNNLWQQLYTQLNTEDETGQTFMSSPYLKNLKNVNKQLKACHNIEQVLLVLQDETYNKYIKDFSFYIVNISESYVRLGKISRRMFIPDIMYTLENNTYTIASTYDADAVYYVRNSQKLIDNTGDTIHTNPFKDIVNIIKGSLFISDNGAIQGIDYNTLINYLESNFSNIHSISFNIIPVKLSMSFSLKSTNSTTNDVYDLVTAVPSNTQLSTLMNYNDAAYMYYMIDKLYQENIHYLSHLLTPLVFTNNTVSSTFISYINVDMIDKITENIKLIHLKQKTINHDTYTIKGYNTTNPGGGDPPVVDLYWHYYNSDIQFISVPNPGSSGMTYIPKNTNDSSTFPKYPLQIYQESNSSTVYNSIDIDASEIPYIEPVQCTIFKEDTLKDCSIELLDEFINSTFNNSFNNHKLDPFFTRSNGLLQSYDSGFLDYLNNYAFFEGDAFTITMYISPINKFVAGTNYFTHTSRTTFVTGASLQQSLPLYYKGSDTIQKLVETITEEPTMIANADGYLIYDSQEGDRICVWKNNKVFLSDISTGSDINNFTSNYTWDFDEPIVKVLNYKKILLVFTTQNLYAIYPYEIVTPVETQKTDEETGTTTTTTTNSYSYVYKKTCVLYNIMLDRRYKDCICIFNQLVFFYGNDGQLYLIKPVTTIDDDTRFNLQQMNKSINDVFLNYTNYINLRLQQYNFPHTVDIDDIKISAVATIDKIKIIYTVPKYYTMIVTFDTLTNTYTLEDTVSVNNIIDTLFCDSGLLHISLNENNNVRLTLNYTQPNVVESNVDLNIDTNFKPRGILMSLDTGEIALNNHMLKRFKTLKVYYKNINTDSILFNVATFVDGVLKYTPTKSSLEVRDINGNTTIMFEDVEDFKNIVCVDGEDQTVLVYRETTEFKELRANEFKLFNFSTIVSSKTITNETSIISTGKDLRFKFNFESKGIYKLLGYSIIFKEHHV